MDTNAIRARLEQLRTEIRAERISYGEIAELQALAAHIDPSDVELLEWAGVPEHKDTETIDPPSTAEVMPDIRVLLDYNWDDEERDYTGMVEAGEMEPDDNAHIFTHMRRVDAWLRSFND
jgi:hypothetical protein